MNYEPHIYNNDKHILIIHQDYQPKILEYVNN